MLKQALIEHSLPGLEFALIDPSVESIELMAKVGRRVAERQGADAVITTHQDLESGIDGADFVICSAAVSLQRRFTQDVIVIREYAPNHHITEFGGIQGISCSLRQMRLIDGVARAIEKCAPAATLLNISNPLPRVCLYASHIIPKVVGFCSVAINGFRWIGSAVEGIHESYPYEAAKSKYDFVSGGVNHLSWALEVRDKNGNDVYPRLRTSSDTLPPLTRRYFDETGYLPVPGDDHIHDFLVPTDLTKSLDHTSHGSATERTERLRILEETAAGSDEHWDRIFSMESWERPFDLIASAIDGKSRSFRSLNLANTGQMSQLPVGSFVETPCVVKGRLVEPISVQLPESVLPFVIRADEITRLLVKAGESGNLKWIDEAIELDPTIEDKDQGRLATRKCIELHKDILTQF